MMVKYKLNGWVAFNSGNPELDNLTLDTDEKRIKRQWKGQEIRPCELIINERDVEGDD